ISGAIQQGTLISLNADETPSPARFFEAIQSASGAAARAGNASPRIAFGGERAGLLWSEGKIDEAFRLEQFGSDVAKHSAVDFLCVYPRRHDQQGDPALKRICAEHTAVYYQ